MTQPIAAATLIIASIAGILASPAVAQSEFEASTVTPSSPGVRGMSFRHVGVHRFLSNNHTLKECIAYAYGLTPELIVGGPGWIDSARYNVVAQTPGDTKLPDEQTLAMFQNLLAQRFKLEFHREQKEVAVYNLVLGKSALKLEQSTAAPEKGHTLFIHSASRQAYNLPARNASMAEFASLMQRVVMDRPVVDRTGLSGKFNFDLLWERQGTEFGRHDPPPAIGDASSAAPDVFTAIQQLGLRLEPAKSMVEVLIIDQAEKPDDN